jgi:hypothetical protein
MCTAFGDPVEPDVNCINATSSSPVATGSIGSAESSLSIVTMVSMTVQVFGPNLQVGARGGLVQHRQAGATHPQRLGGGSDLDGEAGKHSDGVAVSDSGSG